MDTFTDDIQPSFPVDWEKHTNRILETTSPEASLSFIDSVVGKAISRLEQYICRSIETQANSLFENFREDVTSDLAKFFLSFEKYSKSIDLTLTPIGTRFYNIEGNCSTLVVEQRPCVRTIRVNETISDGRLATGPVGDAAKEFSVALPYAIFVFGFVNQMELPHEPLSNCIAKHLFFSKKSLDSMSNILYAPCLPNINEENCSICSGDDTNMPPAITSMDNLANYVNEYIGAYWRSTYTSDWSEQYLHMADKDKRFASFKKWAKASKNDPLFILKADLKVMFGLKGFLSTLSKGTVSQNIEEKYKSLQELLSQRVTILVSSLRRHLTDFDVREKHQPAVQVDKFREFLAEFAHKATIVICHACEGEIARHYRRSRYDDSYDDFR